MAYSGGPMYTGETDRAMRIAALLAASVFVGYCTLIIAGFVPNDMHADTLLAWFVCVAWLLLAAFIYFFPTKKPQIIATRLTTYHFLALGTLVFVAGLDTPFTSIFSFLFIASYVYFGWKGLTTSVSLVVATVALDTALRMSHHPTIVFDNLAGLMSIITLGGILIGLTSAQELRRQALIRSQARERIQHERMTTIINNLTDATFSVDAQGTVLMYNAACLSLLDTNESLRGSRINDLFSLTLPDKSKISMKDILKGATRAASRDDIIHTYNDGESIRLEVTYAPIKSAYKEGRKTLDGYIIILRDVTKRKSLEEERDEFISVVSHELRTPITIVEGTLSNLVLMLKKKTNPRLIADTVDIAHDQTLYLAKMVNDLGTLSRAERGVGDEAEDMDVKTLLEDMRQRYQKDAKDHGLELKLELSSKLGTIHSSRLYTEELLQNFITNAIKYTHEGSVTIVGKKVKDKMRFSVKDTGIGISRSDQTKIFDKFYRSEDYRIRETSGTGLGLYVSAKLAHKIGTKIELTSRLNHGSCFSFELPLVPDDPSK